MSSHGRKRGIEFSGVPFRRALIPLLRITSLLHCLISSQNSYLLLLSIRDQDFNIGILSCTYIQFIVLSKSALCVMVSRCICFLFLCDKLPHIQKFKTTVIISQLPLVRHPSMAQLRVCKGCNQNVSQAAFSCGAQSALTDSLILAEFSSLPLQNQHLQLLKATYSSCPSLFSTHSSQHSSLPL